MRKHHLVSSVHNVFGKSKAESERIVTHILNKISESIVNGDEVILPGVGSFKARKSPARRFFNRATGKVEVTPDKNVVRYRAARPVKRALND